MTDFGNSNIPHGYTDEGERELSAEQVERIEKYLERRGPVLECYNCGKEAREEEARIVNKQLVCEDCYAELNLKTKSND